MFSNWKQEKATASLVEEAQALSDRLSSAKPHVVDSHAAAAQFWAAFHLSTGLDLHEIVNWKPAVVARFAITTQIKIAALRKQREYDSSDGLAIWLHTARAVAEPRIARVVREIWQQLSTESPNRDAMTDELLHDAGLARGNVRLVPTSFGVKD